LIEKNAKTKFYSAREKIGGRGLLTLLRRKSCNYSALPLLVKARGNCLIRR
jgi:hypothetical protein